MTKIPTIGIIGGGFCGTATVIQLAKQSKIPLNIVLIDKDKHTNKGLAFSSYNKNHVLNVPAAKMSLFPDEPDHFVNWIRSKPEYSDFVNDELNDTFLPRVIYGEYLYEIFNKVIEDLPENVTVEIINEEAENVTPQKDQYIVKLKSGRKLTADKIVLALGNFVPDNPRIKNNKFYSSDKYFQNPWLNEAVDGLKDSDDILIIGTGLTMVDNVLSLLDKNFKGKIYAISTKGFFPLSHKKRKPYTDIIEELHPPYRMSELYKIFRKHIKHVLANGISGEAVVDAVRPKTQEIWLSLSTEDKVRFMSHIRHLWGVARHRLPKEIFDKMQELMKEGRLEIIGGRLIDVDEKGGKLKVTLRERRSQSKKELKVVRVINCTGPKTDLNKIDDPLVKNLLKNGLVTADEMKLGVNALPDGTVIHRDNSISSSMFAVGSMLKGVLWESTAVPELRMQAKSIAENLLKQFHPEESNSPKKKVTQK